MLRGTWTFWLLIICKMLLCEARTITPFGKPSSVTQQHSVFIHRIVSENPDYDKRLETSSAVENNKLPVGLRHDEVVESVWSRRIEKYHFEESHHKSHASNLKIPAGARPTCYQQSMKGLTVQRCSIDRHNAGCPRTGSGPPSSPTPIYDISLLKRRRRPPAPVPLQRSDNSYPLIQEHARHSIVASVGGTPSVRGTPLSGGAPLSGGTPLSGGAPPSPLQSLTQDPEDHQSYLFDVRVHVGRLSQDVSIVVSTSNDEPAVTDFNDEVGVELTDGERQRTPMGPTDPCWVASYRPTEGWAEANLILRGLPLIPSPQTLYTVTVLDLLTSSLLAQQVFTVGDLSSAIDNLSKPLDFREVLQSFRSDNVYQNQEDETLDDWSTLFPDRGDDGLTDEPSEVHTSGMDTNHLSPFSGIGGQVGSSNNADKPLQHSGGRVRRDDSSACRCPLPNNMTHHHVYDVQSAMFSLNVSSEPCDAECCDGCKVKVSILKYNKNVTADTCPGLERSHAVLDTLTQVYRTSYLSLNSLYEVVLPSGCYIAMLELKYQWFYGFFWVQPITEPPDLNNWNTTFFLEPRPPSREVEVRWSEPLYPYNFSSYSLQLWYQANPPDGQGNSPVLTCTGHLTHDRSLLSQVEPTPSLPVTEARGVYRDLAPGWYCARVTPVDPRCPPDGCAVRTSHTIRLLDVNNGASNTTSMGKESNTDRKFMILLGVLLTLLGVILCLLGTVAFWRYRRRRVMAPERQDKAAASSVTKVPLVNGVNGTHGSPVTRTTLSTTDTTVLIAWTALADHDGRVKSAVSCLKKLMTPYCKVIDYQDLNSLDVNQRENFLQNPAGWLYTAVVKSSMKVVLISSTGASMWQRAVQEGGGGTSVREEAGCCDPMDRTLFPYLLQLLLHNTALVANYSKVFVVRLNMAADPLRSPLRRAEDDNEETSDVAGLRGIASGLVYTLPLHLVTLLRALRGEPDTQTPDGGPPLMPITFPEDDFRDFSKYCV